MQNDTSGEIFSKQLIDICNDKIPVNVLLAALYFLSIFVSLLKVAQNYIDHFWLSKRAILVAKNMDVNEINYKIQN